MDENQDANNGNTSVGDEYSLDVDSPLGTKDFGMRICITEFNFQFLNSIFNFLNN